MSKKLNLEAFDEIAERKKTVEQDGSVTNGIDTAHVGNVAMGLRKCPKCESLLPGDSEFCQYCGINIEEFLASILTTRANKPEEEKEIKVKQKKHIGLKIGTIVAVLVAVGSLAFNVIQYQSASNLKLQLEEVQEDYRDMLNEKNTAVKNTRSLRSELDDARRELDKVRNTALEYYSDLRWYENNVALTNNYYGNCAYHTISCYHLGSSFYVMTDHAAESKGCWACSDCHS